MKKLLFLVLVFILSIVLIIGCATTPQIETYQIETYQREELKPFINVYLETFGNPVAQMHAKHDSENWEYVEFYWKIENQWYLVILIKKNGEWRVTYDEFKEKRA